MNTFDASKLQNIDSQICEHMKPHVLQAIGRYGKVQNLTAANIDRMTMMVMNSCRFRRYPIAGHDAGSLKEIARLFILIGLYNNYGYDLTSFWQLYYGGPPYFLSPFLSAGWIPFGNWNNVQPPHSHSGRNMRPSHSAHNRTSYGGHKPR